MGCCNSPTLKRIENESDAVVFEYRNGSTFRVHRDDIISYSVSANLISVSLSIGYKKEFTREGLNNFDEVIGEL